MRLSRYVRDQSDALDRAFARQCVSFGWKVSGEWDPVSRSVRASPDQGRHRTQYALSLALSEMRLAE